MGVNWIIAGGMMLAAGGLFVSLLVLGLAQASARADRDWRLERIERKLDLVLTHLGIAHEDHFPNTVVDLVRLGKSAEAVDAYRAATGSSPKIARLEVDWLQARLAAKQTQHNDLDIH